MGGTLSAGTLSAIMSGCQPDNTSGWTPSLFSKEQIQLVAEIADTLLPKTNTPGAKELNIHRYIDDVLLTCHDEEMQKKVMEGLTSINSASTSIAGKDFVKAPPEDRKTVIDSFDKETFDIKDEDEREEHFFWVLKSLTVTGFFSTEVGQTQILQHAAVPGKWQACIPLAEAGNGKTWAQ